MSDYWLDWFKNQDLLGSILAFILTIVLVKWVIPLIFKRKNLAQEKLNGFYNIAYAFIKIREDFSVPIDGEIHNKLNCGYFHNFNFDIDRKTSLIYDEFRFFDFVFSKFSYIDNSLQDLFIEYLKTRGPENIQNKLSCKDGKLIRLRREIEEKITEQYRRYKKQSNG